MLGCSTGVLCAEAGCGIAKVDRSRKVGCQVAARARTGQPKVVVAADIAKVVDQRHTGVAGRSIGSDRCVDIDVSVGAQCEFVVGTPRDGAVDGDVSAAGDRPIGPIAHHMVGRGDRDAARAERGGDG